MISWRTTTAGILAIVAALVGALQSLLDANPATNPDWTAIAAAIMAGVGLLSARDQKVTSEQAGAK